jgi:hypothetical protein
MLTAHFTSRFRPGLLYIYYRHNIKVRYSLHMNPVTMMAGRILLKHSSLLVYGIAVLSWQFLTKTPLTIPIVLTLAGLCVAIDLLARFSAIFQAASTASEAEPEKREFVDNPRAVLDAAKLTGYDAIRGLSPYLGKWMTISGVFEGTARAFGENGIHVSILLDDRRRINLRFGVAKEDQIRGLRVGQRITAIGKIQQSYLVFAPEECELVRAAALPIAS